MRKIFALALALIAAPVTAGGPHFGTAGGIGSENSTYANGEPSGGAYAINGATGAAKFGSIVSTGSITAPGLNVSGAVALGSLSVNGSLTGSAISASGLTVSGVASTGALTSSSTVSAKGISIAGSTPDGDAILVQRYSDSSPSGYFQRFTTSSGNSLSFTDVLGNHAAQSYSVNGPAATGRPVTWTTATTPRWQALTNNAAESGSNAGSDFDINAYSDNGTLLGTALEINRKTLAFGVNGPATLSSSLTVGGNSSLNTLGVNGASSLNTLAVANGSTLNGLTVNGASSLFSLTASGATTLSTLSVNGASTVYTLTGLGAATFNSSLTIGGATLLDSSLSVPNYALASFGPNGLLEAAVPNTESASKFTVRNPVGGIGIVASSQTSDSANTGGDSTEAFGGFVINNNTMQLQNAHAEYLEARSIGAVGATLGIESAVVRSGGDSPTITPYAMVQNGMTASYWGTGGRDGISGAGRASAFMGIYKSQTNGSFGYKAGIVFDYQSIDPGFGMNAIWMQPAYNIRWSDAVHDALVQSGTLLQANTWSDTTPYTVNVIRARGTGSDTQNNDTLGITNYYSTISGSPTVRASVQAVQINSGRGSYNINATADDGTLDTVTLNYNANHSFGPAVASRVSSGSTSLPWLNTYTNSLKLSPVAFASLPSCTSALEGTLYAVTDSTTGTFGGAISGGGGNHVMAYCNGFGWAVH